MSSPTEFPESANDLLTAPLTAILSTIAPGGLIQSTAVWYLFDGGELKVSLSEARKKTRNLLDNPTATLFVLDPANAFHFVEVRGTVTSSPDEGYVFRDKVGAFYDTDLSQIDGPTDKRLVFTFVPSRINAQ